MVAAEYVSLLQRINREIEDRHLTLPIHETPLDSLDLLELRSSLEAKGFRVSSELWFKSDTLQELFEGLL